VKRVNFIIEKRCIDGLEFGSNKTLSFFKLMAPEVFEPTTGKHDYNHATKTSNINHNDNFKLPFKPVITLSDGFHERDIMPRCKNVFVVYMVLNYIKATNFDLLYELQEKYSNVILYADYSNESLFPGNFKQENCLKLNFDPSKFICSMLSLHNGYEINSPKFMKLFPNWKFASGAYYEIVSQHTNKYLPTTLPSRTWEGKQTLHKFFCPNRLGRQNRLDLIVELHKRGVLKQCEWTMMMPDASRHLPKTNGPQFGSNITYNTDHEYFRLFGTTPRQIHQTLFEKEWSDPDSRYNQGGPHESIPETILDRTSAMIISDTYNDDSLICDVSEKIMKPIMFGMPVFYNGRKGAIDKLREHGFWFPGDYNHIDYYKERTSAMIDACEDFEDVITKETAEHVLENKRLITDRHTHWNLSKNLFEFILDF
jgi:hypothetical protein